MVKSAEHSCKGAEVFTQRILQTLLILNASTFVVPSGNGKFSFKILHFFFPQHLAIYTCQFVSGDQITG